MGGADITGLGEGHEISANALELGGWHIDRSSVLGIRNTQVLLIDIHEFQVILAQSITLAALEHHVENIWRIICLECQNILILGSAENLCKGGKVDTKSDVTIASVWGESL